MFICADVMHPRLIILVNFLTGATQVQVMHIKILIYNISSFGSKDVY